MCIEPPFPFAQPLRLPVNSQRTPLIDTPLITGNIFDLAKLTIDIIN